MSNLLNKINFLIENIFGYIGIMMICIASYAVFARLVLQTPSTWTDETLKLLFVWSIFTCSGLAFLNGELIGLDLITEKFSNNPLALFIVKLLQNIVSLIFGLLTVFWAYQIIDVQFITGETTTVVNYPLWIINLGFMLGNILITVFSIYKIIDIIYSRNKQAAA